MADEVDFELSGGNIAPGSIDDEFFLAAEEGAESRRAQGLST